MDDREWLTERFEAHRPRLRAVAYRMLGSLSEAEDALQDSWLRLDRADTGNVENLEAWLTTVVAAWSSGWLDRSPRPSQAPLTERNNSRPETTSSRPDWPISPIWPARSEAERSRGT
jgi:DNA-directed RNA polymerase specialized sigma24 family protein